MSQVSDVFQLSADVPDVLLKLLLVKAGFDVTYLPQGLNGIMHRQEPCSKEEQGVGRISKHNAFEKHVLGEEDMKDSRKDLKILWLSHSAAYNLSNSQPSSVRLQDSAWTWTEPWVDCRPAATSSLILKACSSSTASVLS